MFLRELFEAPKTAVFAFGRMNPPTIGHAKLADVVKSQQGDPFLFLSQTQKPKTDPLPFPEKMYFASKSFPGVEIGDPKVKTIIQAMQNLEAKGYTDIVYVAGSDRVDSFTKLLNDYNGKDYKFNSIKIVSAGERDPDAEGAEGMSASKMRAAAQEGDYNSFKKGVASPMFALSMYDQVRKGMGIATEDESLDEWAVPALRGVMAVGKIGKFFWNNKWAIGFLTATWKVYPWVRDAVKWANRFLDHPVTQALGRYGLPAVGIAVALYGGTKLYNELIKTKNEKELEKVLIQFEPDKNELEDLIAEFEKLTKEEQPVKEADVVVDKSSLVPYIKNLIMDYLDKEQDVEKLSKLLKMMVGREIKTRGGKRYTITREDISLALQKNG